MVENALKFLIVYEPSHVLFWLGKRTGICSLPEPPHVPFSVSVDRYGSTVISTMATPSADRHQTYRETQFQSTIPEKMDPQISNDLEIGRIFFSNH